MSALNFSLTGGFSKVNRSDQLAPALEISGYLTLLAIAIVMFSTGWISPADAALLTLLWLISLIVLAWKRFGQGRHPAFFFLCLLTLFQGGRLLAFGTEAETEIFRVTLMTPTQFDIPRNIAGTVLFAVALSALAIYAPCRWNYRPLPPLRGGRWHRFLPYLYWLFYLSLPVQLYKNYCYYVYARDHGGYLVFFIDHGGLAASIPLVVRSVALVSLPALVGILVVEQRRKFLHASAALYFAVATPVLLTGSRGAIFSLILSLWYLTQAKSGKRVRLFALGLVAVSLLLVGALIGSMRIENGESHPLAGPMQFIADQGMSLHVTEVAVLYRSLFAPHIGSYLAGELQSAFVAADQANYAPGKRFSDDVAMFLNPITYQLGFGSGSSYVAEAYILGGLFGVAVISAALGVMLHALHVASANPLGLFLVTMILPDLLWMPRGGLLDWASAALRVSISFLLLAAGWCVYRTLARMGSLLWQGRNARFASSTLVGRSM
jgi:oligosaccharide repeat unit polymerase